VEETKEIKVYPLNDFECSIQCPFLRKYSSVMSFGSYWVCELYNTRLTVIEDKVHRAAKCNNTAIEFTPPGNL
jgi:hypothetical protein